MKTSSLFLLSAISYLFLTGCINSDAEPLAEQLTQEVYQCTPCGRDCDNKEYSNEGVCKDCNMVLVMKKDVHFNTIHPDTICRYIRQHPDIILLDVRTKDEFEGKSGSFGSLKNAINIPIQELYQKIKLLEDYKNKEIIVYCSHSHRSPRAAYMLTQNGFTKVTNMSGGMSIMKDKACTK